MSTLPARRLIGLALAPAVVGSLLVLVPAAPASAEDPASAADFAAAVATKPGLVTGATYLRQPDPYTALAAAVPIGGFPTAGDSFGILSSGDAEDSVESDPEWDKAWEDDSEQLSPIYDVTTLVLDLDVPTGAGCLGLDYEFITAEEVDSGFYDTFLAQLDSTEFETNEFGQPVEAPGNFATSDGQPMVVDEPLGWQPWTALPPDDNFELSTTGPLRGSTEVTPGAHQVALTVWDSEDAVVDTFAYVDNLFAGSVDGDGVCQPNLAPSLDLPGDITAEAAGPDGATVEYAVSASDPEDGELAPDCTPASGATFPLGVTEVLCSVEDSGGSTDVGAFDVTVEDSTGPAIDVPENIEAEATGAGGATVTWDPVTATDLVDGAVTPTCDAAPGDTFPLGETTIECSATDDAGNPTTETFTVTVGDSAGPVITVPDDITVEATGPAGAAVTWSPVTAVDAVDGEVTVSCATESGFVASGDVFPLGTDTVGCEAVDSRDNSSYEEFTVTVRDTTAPTVTVPSDISVPRDSDEGATVEFEATASDLVDGTTEVVCDPASGTVFAEGETTVVCTSTDEADNTGEASFTVTVTAPLDGDEDGVPDYVEEEQGTDPADPDSDGDGLDDGAETVGEDVCATGTTDALDPDTDGDGLEDGPEIAGVVVKQRVEKRNGSVRIGLVRTDGCARDTDGDGLRDSREIGGVTIRQQVLSGGREKDGPEHWFTYVIGKRFTDPTRADTDNDGRSDGQEVAGRKYRGQLKRTDPTNWDTDRGGASDSREIAVGSDPTDISSGPKRPRMGHRSVG